MVCDYCKGRPHNGQPKNCRGGTWCDCLHRPTIVHARAEREIIPFPIIESATIGVLSSDLGEPNVK